MAVKSSCAGEFIHVKGYKLNVTLRNAVGCEMLADKDDSLSATNPMGEVMIATIEAWLLVTAALENNDPEPLMPIDSPEIAKNFVTTMTDVDGQLTDPMCTVWGKFKGVSLTVVSNEMPIDAYRTALAWKRAFKVVGASWNSNGQPVSVEQQVAVEEAHNNPCNQTAPTMAQEAQRRVGVEQPVFNPPSASSAGLPDGVIWANRDINTKDYNELQYENGQGVAYNISNIELTETQTGKPCIKLTSPQGKFTIFFRNKKGDKRSPDFAKLVSGDGAFIEAKYQEFQEHGDRFARNGNWTVIMKIAHVGKNGDLKEYKNVAELWAVEKSTGKQPF